MEAERFMFQGYRDWLRLLLIGCLGALVMACRVEAATVTVFAAASLTDVLKEIASHYSESTRDRIVFNFAGSSLLARQIEEGAPADIFFSADEMQMDVLAKKGLIQTNTRRDRLSNSLVIVVAADSSLHVETGRDLAQAGIQHLALADPRAVPAGVYAKAHLEKAGLWKVLSTKVVPTENVRAALAAVEAGNAEAGIVYKTDAAISKKVKIACAIPTSNTPEIRYPMALVREAPAGEAAQRFFKFLDSPQAATTFAKYGFIVRK